MNSRQCRLALAVLGALLYSAGAQTTVNPSNTCNNPLSGFATAATLTLSSGLNSYRFNTAGRTDKTSPDAGNAWCPGNARFNEDGFLVTSTIPAGSRITFSTCNTYTDFDTMLAIYDSCTGATASRIKCDDDAGVSVCPTNRLLTKFTINVTTSKQLVVRVGGPSTASTGSRYGDMQLDITLVLPTCLTVAACTAAQCGQSINNNCGGYVNCPACVPSVSTTMRVMTTGFNAPEHVYGADECFGVYFSRNTLLYLNSGENRFGFDTRGASSSRFPDKGRWCEGPTRGGFRRDLFYITTPIEAGNTITISTCDPSTTFDTVIGVYSNCFYSFGRACNNNANPTCGANPYSSSFTFRVTQRGQFIIRIGGSNWGDHASSGTGTLIITVTPPVLPTTAPKLTTGPKTTAAKATTGPKATTGRMTTAAVGGTTGGLPAEVYNGVDTCIEIFDSSDAVLVLSQETNVFPFDLSWASYDGFPDDGTWCAAAGVDTDIWFYTTPVPAGWTITISTCDAATNFDTVIAVYSNCFEAGTVCSDDDCPAYPTASSMSILVAEDSEETSFIIRVAVKAGTALGSNGQGNLIITLTPPAGSAATTAALPSSSTTALVPIATTRGSTTDEPLPPPSGPAFGVDECFWIMGNPDAILILQDFVNRFTFDTTEASSSNRPDDCRWCRPNSGIKNDLWFLTSEIPAGSTVSISTCDPSTDFRTVVAVYTSCLWALGGYCRDSSRPEEYCPATGNNQASLTFYVPVARAYIIRLGGYKHANPTKGHGIITITVLPPWFPTSGTTGSTGTTGTTSTGTTGTTSTGTTSTGTTGTTSTGTTSTGTTGTTSTGTTSTGTTGTTSTGTTSTGTTGTTSTGTTSTGTTGTTSTGTTSTGTTGTTSTGTTSTGTTGTTSTGTTSTGTTGTTSTGTTSTGTTGTTSTGTTSTGTTGTTSTGTTSTGTTGTTSTGTTSTGTSGTTSTGTTSTGTTGTTSTGTTSTGTTGTTSTGTTSTGTTGTTSTGTTSTGTTGTTSTGTTSTGTTGTTSTGTTSTGTTGTTSTGSTSTGSTSSGTTGSTSSGSTSTGSTSSGTTGSTSSGSTSTGTTSTGTTGTTSTGTTSTGTTGTTSTGSSSSGSTGTTSTGTTSTGTTGTTSTGTTSTGTTSTGTTGTTSTGTTSTGTTGTTSTGTTSTGTTGTTSTGSTSTGSTSSGTTGSTSSGSTSTGTTSTGTTGTTSTGTTSTGTTGTTSTGTTSTGTTGTTSTGTTSTGTTGTTSTGSTSSGSTGSTSSGSTGTTGTTSTGTTSTGTTGTTSSGTTSTGTTGTTSTGTTSTGTTGTTSTGTSGTTSTGSTSSGSTGSTSSGSTGTTGTTTTGTTSTGTTGTTGTTTTGTTSTGTTGTTSTGSTSSGSTGSTSSGTTGSTSSGSTGTTGTTLPTTSGTTGTTSTGTTSTGTTGTTSTGTTSTGTTGTTSTGTTSTGTTGTTDSTTGSTSSGSTGSTSSGTTGSTSSGSTGTTGTSGTTSTGTSGTTDTTTGSTSSGSTGSTSSGSTGSTSSGSTGSTSSGSTGSTGTSGSTSTGSTSSGSTGSTSSGSTGTSGTSGTTSTGSTGSTSTGSTGIVCTPDPPSQPDITTALEIIIEDISLILSWNQITTAVPDGDGHCPTTGTTEVADTTTTGSTSSGTTGSSSSGTTGSTGVPTGAGHRKRDLLSFDESAESVSVDESVVDKRVAPENPYSITVTIQIADLDQDNWHTFFRARAIDLKNQKVGGLQPESSYMLRAYTTNVYGDSPYSAVIVIRTLPPMNPSAPPPAVGSAEKPSPSDETFWTAGAIGGIAAGAAGLALVAVGVALYVRRRRQLHRMRSVSPETDEMRAKDDLRAKSAGADSTTSSAMGVLSVSTGSAQGSEETPSERSSQPSTPSSATTPLASGTPTAGSPRRLTPKHSNTDLNVTDGPLPSWEKLIEDEAPQSPLSSSAPVPQAESGSESESEANGDGRHTPDEGLAEAALSQSPQTSPTVRRRSKELQRSSSGGRLLSRSTESVDEALAPQQPQRSQSLKVIQVAPPDAEPEAAASMGAPERSTEDINALIHKRRSLIASRKSKRRVLEIDDFEFVEINDKPLGSQRDDTAALDRDIAAVLLQRWWRRLAQARELERNIAAVRIQRYFRTWNAARKLKSRRFQQLVNVTVELRQRPNSRMLELLRTSSAARRTRPDAAKPKSTFVSKKKKHATFEDSEPGSPKSPKDKITTPKRRGVQAVKPAAEAPAAQPVADPVVADDSADASPTPGTPPIPRLMPGSPEM